MKPFVGSVDRTHLFGRIIAEYADNEWRKGFLFGLCTGISIILFFQNGKICLKS